MYRQLVRDWMTPHPISIDPKTVLPEAHRLMQDSHIRRLPVVEKGKLVGIITLGDVREAEPSRATTLSIYEVHYLLGKLTVERIMTRNPVTIAPDASIRNAAQLMLQHKIGGLPVVEPTTGKLVGIITESDIFRIFAQEPEDLPLEMAVP